MPKNSSPQLFHWYANFKKRLAGNPLHVPEGTSLGAAQGENGDSSEMKEKLMLL